MCTTTKPSKVDRIIALLTDIKERMPCPPASYRAVDTELPAPTAHPQTITLKTSELPPPPWRAIDTDHVRIHAVREALSRAAQDARAAGLHVECVSTENFIGQNLAAIGYVH
jgi:hypothetical protein